jgi:hypothetical protein
VKLGSDATQPKTAIDNVGDRNSLKRDNLFKNCVRI